MSVLRPLDKLPGLNTATILLVGTEDALLQQLADSMLKEDCASELKVHLANSLPLPSSVTRPRIDLIVFVINLHSKHSLRNVEESLHHVDAAFFLGKVSFLVTGDEELVCVHPAPSPGPFGRIVRFGHPGCPGNKENGIVTHDETPGRESHCSIHRSTVVKLAHTYRSPLLFCDLEQTFMERLVCPHELVPGPGTALLPLPSHTALGPTALGGPAMGTALRPIEDFRATMAQRLVRMLQICAGHVPGVSALNLLSLLRSSENPSLEDL